MKKAYQLIFVILIIASLALVACGGGDDAGGVSPTEGETTELDRPEPPPEYAGQENPLAGQEPAVAAGMDLYQSNCASCHGENGEGDGPAAASLNPEPQNLTENVDQLSDGYLHWRIAEGGTMAPFNSAMPAWKSILSEDQIWQVVTYLRTLER